MRCFHPFPDGEVTRLRPQRLASLKRNRWPGDLPSLAPAYPGPPLGGWKHTPEGLPRLCLQVSMAVLGEGVPKSTGW